MAAPILTGAQFANFHTRECVRKLFKTSERDLPPVSLLTLSDDGQRQVEAVCKPYVEIAESRHPPNVNSTDMESKAESKPSSSYVSAVCR